METTIKPNNNTPPYARLQGRTASGQRLLETTDRIDSSISVSPAASLQEVLENALDDISSQHALSSKFDCSPPIAPAMFDICADPAIKVIQLTRAVDTRIDMLPAG